MQRLTVVAAALLSALSVYSKTAYVSPSGSSTEPYDSPETAATDANVALATLGEGDELVICEGTNEITSELLVNVNITIRGTDKEVSILKGKSCRVLHLSSACNVSNLTVSGGYVGSASGGGVLIDGANVNFVDCIVASCSVEGWDGKAQGGGIALKAASLVDRCIVRSCWQGGEYHQTGRNSKGGGIYATAGTIRNSLFIGNTSINDGGNAYLDGTARMENCTLTKGKAIGGSSATSPSYVSGLRVADSATVVNCICYGNDGDTTRGVKVATADNVSYCCFPVEIGAHCVTADPLFKNAAESDYRLQVDSPCVNAGDPAAVAEGQLDLAGAVRVLAGRIDIGCYELDPDVINLVVPSANQNVNEPMTLSFTTGGLDGYTFAWTVSAAGKSYSGMGKTFVFTPQETGVFTVKVVATKEGKTPVTAELKDAITVHKIVYVSPTGSATAPYDTPAKAATDPAVALASMVEGQTMELCVGTTEITSQLVVDKNITIRGTDKEKSVLKGKNCRVFQLSSACEVRNLTISNGSVQHSEDRSVPMDGGGVRMTAAGAKVFGCVIDSCTVSSWDGRAYGAGISMTAAGIVDCCIIRNCSMPASVGQDRKMSGGGLSASAGIVRNTLIVGNEAHNSASNARINGTARMENCTIVGGQKCLQNESAVSGLLVEGNAAASNCIIWGNYNDLDFGGTAANVSYCCSKAGVGSNPVTADPLFKNAANGDYRLTGKSPCVNAGDPATVIAEGQTDLAGAKRVSGRIVDLGCFERAASGLILLFQ